jgi:hypothetical protein
MKPIRASRPTFRPDFDVIYLDRVLPGPYNARNENTSESHGTQYYYCSKGSGARMGLEVGPSASVRTWPPAGLFYCVQAA